ncbi:MAG: cytochrome c biogenesis protein CcdA [Nitriliruptorales bacterium]|nr:cytochrome c biogenesis protein CcdA [Nitriliruptorales bacterium]
MNDTEDRSRFALLTAGVVVLGLAGYVGYVLYPRFGLPSVTGASVLVLGAAAGLAAFFSPCSFPLLAALLARQTAAADEDRSPGRQVGAAVRFAGGLSLGALVFVLGVGLLFALGGRGLAGAVTFTSTSGRVIRLVVGLLLIVLGLVQTGRIRLSLERLDLGAHERLLELARRGGDRSLVSNVVFGFGYLAAGFG